MQHFFWLTGKWKLRNALCNSPASKNILMKTKHEASPFTPYKLTNKPGELCSNSFLLQNPTSVYSRLKVLSWFWTSVWKTRGCFPFHSPDLSRAAEMRPRWGPQSCIQNQAILQPTPTTGTCWVPGRESSTICTLLNKCLISFSSYLKWQSFLLS